MAKLVTWQEQKEGQCGWNTVGLMGGDMGGSCKVQGGVGSAVRGAGRVLITWGSVALGQDPDFPWSTMGSHLAYMLQKGHPQLYGQWVVMNQMWFLRTTYSPDTTHKTADKPKQRDVLRHDFLSVLGMKDKEKPRTCPRWEETQGSMWSQRDLGQKKDKTALKPIG